MAAPTSPLDRVLDAFVYIPLGIAVAVRDDVDALATNGRREVDLARSIGRLAVQFGRSQIERKLTSLTTGPQRGPGTEADAPSAPPAPDPGPTPPVARPPRARPALAASGSTMLLPIADYDSLAASQVISRLGALTPEELTQIRAYETAMRARRTIIGKLDQLERS